MRRTPFFCNISVAVTNRDLTADLKPEIVCCGVNEKEKVLLTNVNKTYLARRKELESLTFGSVDQRSIQLS